MQSPAYGRAFFVAWLFCAPGVYAQPKTIVEKISPQLVYLLDFEETTRLLNDEFERTNSEAVKTQRREAIRLFMDSARSRRQPQPDRVSDDTYAVAVSENIVQWMNETLRKICAKMPDKNYIVVDAKTVADYDVENYRYVLRYTYTFEGGDPIKARMVFYYYDRVEHKAMIHSRALAGKNTYYPFFYYKGEKSYPFYGVIRSGRVRKAWVDFFRNL